MRAQRFGLISGPRRSYLRHVARRCTYVCAYARVCVCVCVVCENSAILTDIRYSKTMPLYPSPTRGIESLVPGKSPRPPPTPPPTAPTLVSSAVKRGTRRCVHVPAKGRRAGCWSRCGGHFRSTTSRDIHDFDS